MRFILLVLILSCFCFESQAQFNHAAIVGGSINYKGYQTGLGYELSSKNHLVQFTVFKNQSINRLFASNHFALGLAYKYRIKNTGKLLMGPELDYQKMFLNKVNNRFNDSRIVSLAYYLQWNITEHISISNSIGTGGYIERFYVHSEEEPDYFRGVGGLIKLRCAYQF